MPTLCEIFKQFRGQPVEIIVEGFKVVGIVCHSDQFGVTLIDHCSRLVHFELCQIQAVVEPQMRLCKICDNDCHELGIDLCDCDDFDHRRRHRRHRDDCECEREREDKFDRDCEFEEKGRAI